ncbi:allantoate amidohydrolase [Vibrio sp.]|nr:allantoate amidohydrolase [Vibrio sp.]
MPVTRNTTAQRVMSRIEQLAAFSSMAGMVTRAYLTKEHKEAHEQIGHWMREAGLQTWQDEVGNQWGRLVSAEPTQAPIIIGSHSDTVVNAGKYDGTLGVILAIEALDRLKDTSFPFHIDIVAFADEEGTRFNTTLLGSSGVCGMWNPEWLSIADAEGTTIGEAMKQFGLDVNAIGKASRIDEAYQSYLEVHIEQGPVLENRNLPVGVVTGIAGAKRYLIDIKGVAGHAGTVPLGLRNDALCAVAEMISTTERFAGEQNIVATVGKCNIRGGAVNVIPGDVQFSLDIRCQDQALLDSSCEELLQLFSVIAGRRNVALTAENIYQAKAVPCDMKLQAKWANVIESVTGEPAFYLPSGAGHDAMMMANITPVGMLFLRCEKGISHNPRENVDASDVAITLSCLQEMILSFR